MIVCPFQAFDFAMTFSFGDAFRNRHALVTGGTSGIGLAIGHALAAHGAHVVVTGLTDAEASAAELAPLRGKQLDVADDASVNRLIAAFDSLDILVNCAGMIRRGDEHSVDVFERVVDVNLVGTMRCCAAARPKLARTQGCIVNTASMLSFFGGGLVPAYSASKGGIAQLTKSLAAAYAADGIRVNAVAPGWIDTPLTKALQADPKRNETILARTPMGRWGSPDDVAGPVLFLCSPAAAFVTGVVLPVDGGYLVV